VWFNSCTFNESKEIKTPSLLLKAKYYQLSDTRQLFVNMEIYWF
jgi:hypothetical protein